MNTWRKNLQWKEEFLLDSQFILERLVAGERSTPPCCFHGLKTPAHRVLLPTFRMALPSSVKPLRRQPLRSVQRHVSEWSWSWWWRWTHVYCVPCSQMPHSISWKCWLWELGEGYLKSATISGWLVLLTWSSFPLRWRMDVVFIGMYTQSFGER